MLLYGDRQERPRNLWKEISYPPSTHTNISSLGSIHYQKDNLAWGFRQRLLPIWILLVKWGGMITVGLTLADGLITFCRGAWAKTGGWFLSVSGTQLLGYTGERREKLGVWLYTWRCCSYGEGCITSAHCLLVATTPTFRGRAWQAGSSIVKQTR
jgi:hypothetical protein